MTDARALTQQALYGLFPGCKVFHYKRGDVDTSEREYIVYTQADDAVIATGTDLLCRAATVYVRWYLREDLLNTADGIALIYQRTNAIIAAMEAKGFLCPDGAENVGEIELNGYTAFVMVCDLARVV